MCSKRCGFAYPIEWQCKDSVNCLWDPVNQICRADCSTELLETCSKNPLCIVEVGRAYCQRKCQYRHSVAPNCNRDTTCLWDSTKSSCVRACVSVDNEQECESNPACTWEQQHCRLQCKFSYTTKDACTKDVLCIWDVNTQQCTGSCGNFVKEADCSAHSSCKWKDQKCIQTCINRYSDAARCNADSECIWDWTNSHCSGDCGASYTPADCMNNPTVCMWDSGAGKCRRTCRMRWEDMESCDADKLCQWDMTFLFCKANCDTLRTADDCRSTHDCDYDEKRALCKMSCSESDAEECEANDLCDAESDGACVKKCPLAYTEVDVCETESDGRCMWDKSLNVCRRSCKALYKDPDGQDLKTKCENIKYCRYRETVPLKKQRCQKKCIYAYKSESACASSGECMWDPIWSSCQTLCSVLETEGTCLGEQMCEWNANQNLCKKQCLYRYTTADECNADTDCKWEPSNSLCQQSCERYTNELTCTADPMCEFNTKMGKCVLPCNRRHKTSASCKSDTTCMYDNIILQCRRDCSYIDKENTCSADNMCSWRGTLCEKRCTYKYVGASTSTACEVDPYCMWDYSSLTCRDDCNVYVTASSCEAEPMCNWDSAKGKCVKECPYESESECANDPRCIWQRLHLTSGIFTCKRICETRHATPDACDLDDQCMYKTSQQKCIPSCAARSVTMCSYEPAMCEVRNGACKKPCAVLHINSINCTQDSDCMWDPTRKICSKICGLYDNKQQCTVEGMCDYYNGQCILACRYRLFEKKKCNDDPRCVWDESKVYCRNECNQYGTEALCAADGFCEWDTVGPKCVERCSLRYYNQPAACVAAFPECMYNPATKTCATSCKRITDEFACRAQPDMCEWEDISNVCLMQCTGNADTEAACNELTLCMWDRYRKRCRTVCSELKSEAGCTSMPGCEWKNSVCVKECEQYNESDCRTLSYCEWFFDDNTPSKSYCHKKCMYKYTQEGSCNEDSKCMWNKNGNACGKRCDLFRASQYPSGSNTHVGQCNSNAMCFWTTMGVCQVICQYNHTTPGPCDSDPECMWDTLRTTCTRQCELVTAATGCAVSPMCQWFTKDQKCQKACQYRFFNITTCNKAEFCEWDNSTNRCTTDCEKQYTSSSCGASTMCRWYEETHKFEYFASRGNGFPGAVEACKIEQRLGKWGYLATITSTKENNAARAVCHSSAFLGGSDVAVEGTWRWVTGPQGDDGNGKGLMFYKDGSCVVWCNWASGQPNGWYSWWWWWWGYPENWLYMDPNGQWGDTYQYNNLPFICEFGTSDDGRCLMKCELKYLSKETCNSDYQCLWDPSMGTCRTSCEYLLDSAACNQEVSICVWSQTQGACLRRCEWRHNNEADCIESQDCMWRYDQQTCRQHCGARPSEQECLGDTWCEWSETDGKCRKKCLFNTHLECDASGRCFVKTLSNKTEVCLLVCEQRHNDAASCDDDTYEDCMWDRLESKCTESCSVKSTATSACAKEPMCEAVAKPTRCVKRCRYRYFDQQACNADSTCQWDWKRTRCTKKCNQYVGVGECNADETCHWTVDLTSETTGDQICIQRCAYKYNATQRVQCDQDHYCSFNTDAAECQETCAKHIPSPTWGTDKDRSDRCNGDSFCDYNDKTNECYKACPSIYNKTECLLLVSCMWDKKSSECKTSCELRPRADCLAEPSFCTWYSEQNACKNRCVDRYQGEENKDRCNADKEDCRFDTRTLTCKDACSRFSYYTCASNWDCEWDKVNGKCVPTCPTYSIATCNVGDPFRCRVWSPGYQSATSNHHESDLHCEQTCRYQYYNNPTGCAGDVDCMYQVADKMCTQACGRMIFELWYAYTGKKVMPKPIPQTYTAAPTAAPGGTSAPGVVNVTNLIYELCIDTPQCEWFDGTCQEPCVTAYLTSGQCNEDYRCKWDSGQGKCRNRCTFVFDKASCKADATCEWVSDPVALNGEGPQCKDLCVYRHLTEEACDNDKDPECQWDSQRRQCKTACKYSTRVSCEEFSACDWENNTCVETCKSMCNTRDCCLHYDHCMWDRYASMCRTHCTLMENAECTSVATMCFVDNNINKCKMKCSERVPGSGEVVKNQCNSDPECLYSDLPYQNTCTRHCDYRTTSTECVSNGDLCKWDSKTNKCSRQCHYLASVYECQADSSCDWRAGRSNYMCDIKCVYRQTRSAQCNADAECMWDVVRQQCTEECWQLNNSVCNLNAMCEVREDKAVCDLQCKYNYNYYSRGACEADVRCKWDAYRGQCQVDCETQNSRDKCLLGSMCEWRIGVLGGKCMKQCAYRYYTNEQCVSRQDGQMCEWSAARHVCRNSCEGYAQISPVTGMYEMYCKQDSLCEWLNDDTHQEVCSKICAARENAAECLTSDRCKWDSQYSNCQLKCAQHNNSRLCTQDHMCQWSKSGICQAACEYRYSAQDACNRDQDCLWRENKKICTEDCWAYYTPADCGAITECQWDLRTRQCHKTCRLLSTQDACEYYTECVWKGDSTGYCTYSCTSEYSTQPPCDEDSDCMWDPTGRTCKRTCSSINPTNTGGTLDFTKQQCVAEPMCNWQNNECHTRCIYGHGTKSLCQQDVECVWDVDNQRCNYQCSMLTTKAMCVANGICEWNITSLKCEPECKWAYRTAATCEASAQCAWSTDLNYCTHACRKLTTGYLCARDSSCEWTGSRCMDSCMNTYHTRSECDAHEFDDSGVARCMWDPLQARCETHCNALNIEGCKENAAMCIYDPLGDPDCRMKCEYAYASYNISACDDDVNCMYDESKTVCTASCRSLTNAQACNNVQMCEWDTYDSVCMRSCSSRSSNQVGAQCSEDSRCEIYNNKCQLKCEVKYRSNAAQCNADPTCMFLAVTSKCTASCSRLAVLACVDNKMCEWKATGCDPRCEYRHLSSVTCGADPECLWDSERQKCTRNCVTYPTEGECYGAPLCQYRNGKCVMQCNFRWHNEKDCDADLIGACWWDNVTGSCTNNCNRLGMDADLCDSTSVCRLTGNQRTGKYERIIDGKTYRYDCIDSCVIANGASEAKCKADKDAMKRSRCSWDPNSQICFMNCALITTETLCFGTDICEFISPSTCRLKCEYVGDCNRTDCKKNTYGQCSSSCSRHLSQSDCDADTTCTWAVKQSLCFTKCSQELPSSCESNPMCYKKADGSCERQCSTKYVTPEPCNADSKCMYDTSVKQCKATCSEIVYTASDTSPCTNEMMCELRSVGCRQRCRFRGSDKTSCEKNSDCEWSSVDNMCVRKCESITDSSECQAVNLCVWVGDQCKLNCAGKYKDLSPKECEDDPTCTYSNTRAQCITDCTIYTEKTCEMDSQCMLVVVSSNNRKCLPSCFAAYGTEPNCTADTECLWNRKIMACTRKCDRLKAQVLCEASKDTCYWSSGSCKTLCGIKYTTKTDCSADSECMWDSFSQTCIPACKSYVTSPSCRAQTDCTWSTSPEHCLYACKHYPTDATCKADSTCFWNGLQLKCSTQCALRYPVDNQACNQDSECMWDSSVDVCYPKCDLLFDKVSCSSVPTLCKWVTLADGSLCIANCKRQYPTHDTCVNETSCEWDPYDAVCNNKCELVPKYDEVSCLANTQCSYDASNGKCTKECMQRTAADCTTGNSGCALDSKGKCKFSCESITNLTRCEELSSCFVDSANNTCKVSCQATYSNMEDCENATACMWDVSKGKCLNQCPSLSQQMCAAQKLCVLKNTTCEFGCQYNYRSELSCAADSGCIWDKTNLICKEACEKKTTAMECTPMAECDWVGQLQACRRKCELMLPGACTTNDQCVRKTVENTTVCQKACYFRYGLKSPCNADPDCEWNARLDACDVRPCTSPDKDTCESDMQCEWTGSQCGKTPCQWVDEVSCASDKRCEWYTEKDFCVRVMCPPEVSQDNCTARKYCKYNGTQCLKKCEYLGKKADCLVDPKCDWMLELNCRDACEVRANVGLCNGDRNCIYDTARQQCRTACIRRKTEAQCDDFGVCMWTGTYCRVSCTNMYGNDKEKCDKDVDCKAYVFGVTNGVASYMCSAPCSFYLNETTCSSKGATFCSWSAQARGCLEMCSAKYASLSTCNADTNCIWSNTDGCGRSCENLDGVADKESCETYENCVFTTVGCSTKCSSRHSGQGQKPCEDDVKCLWKNTTGTCERACNRYSLDDCVKRKECIIDTINKVCTQACDIRYNRNTTCDLDPLCEWDVMNAVCISAKCKQLGAAECNTTAICQWKYSSCEHACSERKNSALCTESPLCRWDASNATCLRVCPLVSPEKCDYTQQCAYIAPVKSCITDCQYIKSEELCTTQPVCRWDEGAQGCERRCEYRYPDTAEGKIVCVTDPECTLSKNGTCTWRLCQYTVEAICNADPKCQWGGEQSCQLRDCSYWTQSGCEKNSACEWIMGESGAYCAKKLCPPLTPQAECDALPDCKYNALNLTCGKRPCYYDTRALCVTDADCGWNVSASTRNCYYTGSICQYTPWTEWTTCSQQCDGGKQTRRREILRAANDGTPCTEALIQSRLCNQGVPCDCTSITNSYDCVQIPTCEWTDGSCKPLDRPCSVYQDEEACNKAPQGCFFIAGRCVVAAVSVCFGAPAATCSSTECDYIIANGGDTFTPQAKPITLFPNLVIYSNVTTLDGALVYIEGNYSRGKDFVAILDTTTDVAVTWFDDRGVLKLEGTASRVVYESLLRKVVFFTTSTVNKHRRITWSLGANRAYSSLSGHFYQFFAYAQNDETLTWWQAKKTCEDTGLFGMRGYLGTILSAYENELVTGKLTSEGWMGASDIEVEAMWRWVTGPESSADDFSGSLFWKGRGRGFGGTEAGLAYSNWEPPSSTNVGGEPNGGEAENFAIIHTNGLWSDVSSSVPSVRGFLCEWGGNFGTVREAPMNTHGTIILQMNGCVSKTCVVKTTELQCTKDPECLFDEDSAHCVLGCSYATERECVSDSKCLWDTNSVPSRCRINPCSKMNEAKCKSSTDCIWANSTCKKRTGCDRFTKATACASDARCRWNTGTCELAPCSRYGTDNKGTCSADVCIQSCRTDPLCEYVEGASRCVERQCNFLPGDCPSSCQLVVPSGLSYLAGNPPIKLFTDRTISLGNKLSAGIVAIVEGNYKLGDRLTYPSSSDTHTSEFTSAHGMLTVDGLSNEDATLEALKLIQYSSSSKENVARTISYVVQGQTSDQLGPVFISSLKLFYEFVHAEGVAYPNAKLGCESRTLHGMTGQLASINSQVELSHIVTKIGGAPGWLGAKGVASSDGSAWSWDTASNKKTFFIGSSVIGTALGFTAFAPSEPQNVPSSGPLYLMLLADGLWYARDAHTSTAQGYYCMYRPDFGETTDEVLKAISGTVEVLPVGCFPKECSRTESDLCIADGSCEWVNGNCSKSVCQPKMTASECATVPGCYYDPTGTKCSKNELDECVKYTTQAPCEASTKHLCVWTTAGCLDQSCSRLPTQAACDAVQQCVWRDNVCIDRLCGHTTREACISDTQCRWTASNSTCGPAQCIGAKTEAACIADSQCKWYESATPQCNIDQCPYDTSVFCNADTKCIWNSALGRCERAVCIPTLSQTDCNAISLCMYDTNANKCVKKLCLYTAMTPCNNDTQCIWDTTTVTGYDKNGTQIITPHCRARDITEIDYSKLLSAAGDEGCVEETKDQTVLIVALSVVTVLLIAAVLWLRHRQDPTRAKEFNLSQARNMTQEEMLPEEEEEPGYEPPHGQPHQPLNGDDDDGVGYVQPTQPLHPRIASPKRKSGNDSD